MISENIKPYYCYILYSLNPFYKNYTYNGSTNNLQKRLRQHNGEIVGGAKATKNKGPWDYLLIIEGFLTHNEALSCEWKIKHPTNKKLRPKKYCGVEGRISSLNLILSLDNWTNNSTGLISGKVYKLYIINEFIDLIDKSKIKSNVEIKDINELSL
jgi:predicted GIY-YIG superfamily endonuclease